MGKPIKGTPKKIVICAEKLGNSYAVGDNLEEAYRKYLDDIDENVCAEDLCFYWADEVEVEIRTVILPVTQVTAK